MQDKNIIDSKLNYLDPTFMLIRKKEELTRTSL